MKILLPERAGQFRDRYRGLTLNFGAGQTRANNALLGVLGGILRVKPILSEPGTVDVVIDINGYVQPITN